MRHREAAQDFICRCLENVRQRLLYQRNEVVRENFEVLVDGLADDFTQHFVPAEKVFEIYFSLLNGDSGGNGKCFEFNQAERLKSTHLMSSLLTMKCVSPLICL